MPRPAQAKKKSPTSKKAKTKAVKVILLAHGDVVTEFFEADQGPENEDQFSTRMVSILWEKDIISTDELKALSKKFINFRKAQDAQLMDKVSDRIKLLSFKGGRENELKGAWLEMMEAKYNKITGQQDFLRNEQLKLYQSIYLSLMAESKGSMVDPVKIPSPTGDIIIKIVRISAQGSIQTG